MLDKSVDSKCLLCRTRKGKMDAKAETERGDGGGGKSLKTNI